MQAQELRAEDGETQKYQEELTPKRGEAPAEENVWKELTRPHTNRRPLVPVAALLVLY
jgi:hypothetical protein